MELTINGFGPGKLDVYFFKESIVLGKSISIDETIVLASCNISLWDLKFTVNWV